MHTDGPDDDLVQAKPVYGTSDGTVLPEYQPAVPFPPHGLASGSNNIILPRRVYVQDKAGAYLTVRSGPSEALLTFRAGAPDIDCAFETLRLSTGRYRLIARNGNPIMAWAAEEDKTDSWYSADNNSPTSFAVILAKGNSVYLQDNYPDHTFMSGRLKTTGSPLARGFINEDSVMRISMAAVKTEIVDLKYNLDSGIVRQADPRIALSTSIRNDSSGSDVTKTLEYAYEKWSAGTWNNTAGVEIGVTTSFEAKVPFVAGAKFEISLTASYSHEWGGEEGVRESIKSSTTISVPPKKKAHAKVIVRNAQIDVRFSYTERVLWSNGEIQETKKIGIYRNVDSWHVDVEVTDWESI